MLMRKLRGLIYKIGFRPRPGSIFCSPSLMFRYGFKDAQKETTCVGSTDTVLSEVITPGVFTECIGTSAAIAETLSRSVESPFYYCCRVCGTVEA